MQEIEEQLFQAVQSNNFDAVQKLLQNGADVDVRNADGKTALQLAQDDDIADLLIEYDSDVNVCDENGDSLLHHAVRSGKMYKIKLLIAFGADVNAKNKKQETPIVCTTNQEIKDVLKTHGATE